MGEAEGFGRGDGCCRSGESSSCVRHGGYKKYGSVRRISLAGAAAAVAAISATAAIALGGTGNDSGGARWMVGEHCFGRGSSYGC